MPGPRLSKAEAKRQLEKLKGTLEQVSAKIALGYVRWESDDEAARKGKARSVNFEYVYTFLCSKCQEVTTHDNADTLTQLVVAHYNSDCWSTNSRETVRQYCITVTHSDYIPCDWRLDENTRLTEYTCTFTHTFGQVCQKVYQDPVRATLHCLTHFWPQRGRSVQVY